MAQGDVLLFVPRLPHGAYAHVRSHATEGWKKRHRAEEYVVPTEGWVGIKHALGLALSGEIRDAKTIAAVSWLVLKKARETKKQKAI